jgi:hypothetical protein
MVKAGQLLAVVCMLAMLAACGGKSEAEKEAEGGQQSGEGTITCTGDALVGDSGLPAGFPILDGVTFVEAKDKGPTHVVDGYSDEDIEGLYNEYKDRFAEAEYKVLFSELEEDRGDSEVSYRTKDGKTEGIVALRASCDNDHVSIRITARPA